MSGKFVKGTKPPLSDVHVHFDCAGRRPLFRRATFTGAFLSCVHFVFILCGRCGTGHVKVWKRRVA